MKNLERLGPFLARRPADYVLARVFGSSAAESMTVPALARVVILSGTTDFWVNFTTTAAIPAADVTDGSSAIFVSKDSPIESRTFIVEPSATISIIPPGAAVVTGEFYSN